MSNRLVRGALPLFAILALGSSARGDVLGTDFDSMPTGSYPFGTPGAIELVEGDASCVSIATADDLPRGYRAFATAEWIRSGRFLLVDTRRSAGKVTLRIAFCCGSYDGGCVLLYDQLGIASHYPSAIRHHGRSRDVPEQPCAVATHQAIRIGQNALVLLDNFWAETIPGRKQSSLGQPEDYNYGGEFLATDFDSLPAGLLQFELERHVRLRQGKASSVRILPARSMYLGERVRGNGRCLCIGAADSSDTAVEIDFHLEDVPNAWCQLGRFGGEMDVTVLGGAPDVPPWAQIHPGSAWLGPADGLEHTLVVRVPGGSVVCLDQGNITLRPRYAEPRWQLLKAEADSLVSAWGADAAYQDALRHFYGTFEDQHRAAVTVLAAFGQGTSLWENLGWERTVRGVRSRAGAYCLIRSASEGEFGQSAEAEFCLIGAGEGVRWIRPVQARGTARVSNSGTAVLSHVRQETVELEFVDLAGRLLASRSWPRTWRNIALFGDAEAVELTPDEELCLVTVHGGDSSKTRLHALDLNGNSRWTYDLGEMVVIPTISFTPDGRLILVEGSLRRSGRGKRVIALSLDGTRVRSP